MDYGDLRKYREQCKRTDGLDAISNHFDVSRKEVVDAVDNAGMYYPDDPWQYYFVCSCISAGKDLREEYESGDGHYHEEEALYESAENCVPYQTYVQWMLWVEFGYNDEESEHLDFEQVPQTWLFYRATEIIRDYAEL